MSLQSAKVRGWPVLTSFVGWRPMHVQVVVLHCSWLVADVAAVFSKVSSRPCMSELNCGHKIVRDSTYVWSRMRVWVCVAPMV